MNNLFVNDLKRNIMKMFVIIFCGVILFGCSTGDSGNSANQKSDLDIVKEVFTISLEENENKNLTWIEARLNLDDEILMFRKYLSFEDDQAKSMATLLGVSEGDLTYKFVYVNEYGEDSLIGYEYNITADKKLAFSNSATPKNNMEDVLKENGITVEQIDNALEQYAKEVESK